MKDSISRKEAEGFAKNCIYGKKPACTCSCPINLDVPRLIGCLQDGSFASAYRHYQEQSVFPGIVSRLCTEPCKKACVREDIDEGISLLLLEKACVEFAEKKEPRKFNLPSRNKKIAIIGAGLCGLTCAQRLGAKSYDVTIYEQSGRIGGRLWNLLEPEVFLPEIELQMNNARVIIKLNTKVNSLDEIEFDAALIATGAAGDDFSLLEGMNDESFGTARPGVFIAGNKLGTTPVEDIGQGITAYHSIEKYIKVGLMDGIPETFIQKESPLKMDLSRVEPAEAVKAPAGVFCKDEAALEAQRCLKCNCSACSDCCEIFSHFNNWPCSMVNDAVASLHTKTSIKGQHATRTMTACNLCGLCGKVCPQGIDMGKFFHDFRYFKSEDKMLPRAFHDYFIRDMNFSNGDAYFAHTAPGFAMAAHVFFPGCQLGASDPRYVEKTYDYLLEKIPDTAIIHGCCGAPADWAADKALNEATVENLRQEWVKMGRPVFIFACPTCKHQFEKFMPDIDGISLYELIGEKGMPEGAGRAYGRACVFDPCSSRHDRSMQESVRKIAESAGAELTELFYSREKAQCCGWGGHIQAANPALFSKMVNNRINSEDLPYITYCTNCSDTFSHKGKECTHILDIIHGLDKKAYTPPSLSDRRKNRLTVKRNILKKVWNIEMAEKEAPEMSLPIEIPEKTRSKMNEMLILDEEVYETIRNCESTGYTLYDPEEDLFIGHLRIGIITYWVAYKKDKDKLLVNNVYAHRIEIVENLK